MAKPICPAAAFLEIALAAAYDIHERDSQELTQVAFVRPLLLQQSPAKDVRFTVSAEDGSFRLESRKIMSDDPWTLHVVGRIPATTDTTFTPPRINFRAPDSFGDPWMSRSFTPTPTAWA